MTDDNPFWYHCSRCGSLFQSSTLAKGPRRCTHCGFDPNPQPKENKPPIPFARTVTSIKNEQNADGTPLRLTVRRRKSSRFVTKLILGWLLFAGFVVFLANSISDDKAPKKTPVSEKASIKEKNNMEDKTLLDDSIPLCKKNLTLLLTSSLPEERSQYVYSPITTVMRMEKYQDLNPFMQVEPPELSDSKWSVLTMRGEKAIECVWSCDDGRIFEALFRKEEDSWKIDWDFLVRYSDIPFGIFLSGNGDAEGEFRLLARERLAEERKDMPTISLCFYAPIPGSPRQTGPQSPEFLVDRKSRAGRLIQAAFDARKQNKRPFDAELSNQDPDAMIRINAKIRRSGEKEYRTFEIIELKACHWYSHDDTGFLIEQEDAPKN